MGLCPPNKLYDPFRKAYVEATPEEIVRQTLLSFLVEKLSYPKHAIVVEKQLVEFSTLEKKKIPNRRVDILCFERKTFKPLLLIECKSVPINSKMLGQVMGYNAFVKAPFVCIANQKRLLLSWRDEKKGEDLYSDTLPS